MNERVTVEDLAAQAKGVAAFLDLMARVFPDTPADDLVQRVADVATNETAQILLHQVITQNKIRVAG